MPTISRTNQLVGMAILSSRIQKYSDRLTLVSAASLWMSQNSNGPKKFQFGPRRKVPRTISEHQSTTNPNRKIVISALRSLNVK